MINRLIQLITILEISSSIDDIQFANDDDKKHYNYYFTTYCLLLLLTTYYLLFLLPSTTIQNINKFII